jgi:hypothetical protein
MHIEPKETRQEEKWRYSKSGVKTCARING